MSRKKYNPSANIAQRIDPFCRSKLKPRHSTAAVNTLPTSDRSQLPISLIPFLVKAGTDPC
jgi:hypothetical protein